MSFNSGYTFYPSAGLQARLNDSRRRAERHLPSTEFQNSVVMCSRPLDDGEPFQVVIEKKVSVWSGSVIIGATTVPPERFSFPANLSCLTANCWVVQGKSLWKNGCRKFPNYLPDVLETLTEGNSVGVVKRGQSLYFLVNGCPLRVAEDSLPPDSKVWALVDLYGQCSQVSIVEGENRPAATEAHTPMRFHSRCGDHAHIIEEGAAAYRTDAMSNFDEGVVMSSRPLNDGELFEVEILEMSSRWSGSLELGVTTHNPDDFEFPSTMSSDMGGTWLLSGSSVLCSGSTSLECYTTTGLDTLKVGDRVGLMRRSNGSLVYFINGAELGVAVSALPRLVYAVVDLYGKCSKVRLTSTAGGTAPGSVMGTAQGTAPGSVMGTAVGTAPGSLTEDCTAPDKYLKFHPLCGDNIELLEAGLVAVRRSPCDEYTSATALTSRPLRPGEVFEVAIDVMVDEWSGSLQMGVCLVHPELLDFTEFEELTDLCLPSWILSGCSLYTDGLSSTDDYPLDLDALPQGAKVGVRVSHDGELHFFVNGADMGVAASGLPAEGLFGCVEVYGMCAKISIVAQESMATRSHMTSGTPSNVLENRTAGSSNCREELVVNPVEPVLSTCKQQFHQVHGQHICLSPDKTVAKRIHGFDNGLVFSRLPLPPGEVFEVELTELASKAWQGSLKVGLVAKLPASLPSCIAQLDEGSWYLEGSSLVGHSSATRQGFSIGHHFSCEVGSRLAVWYEEDGWMYLAVDGTDLGPVLPNVTKLPHAVVDLYGTATSARIVNDNNDHGEQPGATCPDRSVHWSSECGGHVQLSTDYLTAKRTRSYHRGVLLSSSPIPNDTIFQCEVREVDCHWGGTISLGVTSLSPRHACLVEKAQELKKRSYILCTECGRTCFYVGGKEVCKVPGVSLGPLEVGSTVGIMCGRDRTLHFFIGHKHLEIALPDGNVRLPKTRYAIVDLYGQCCSVQLRPLQDGAPVGGADISISVEAEDLLHVKRHKVREKQLQKPVGADREPVKQDPRVSVVGPERSASKPRADLDCEYYKLCQYFLRLLSVPDEYLSPELEYSRCYCDSCWALQGEPNVKFSGEPRKMYAVPRGWAKFGLRMSFQPQATQHRSFELWHKAYHGTEPRRVRPILDNGGLLLPGSCLLGGREVEQPPGHYNDRWKPDNHDPHRIFVSPSIKYCSFCDVYTKKHSFVCGGKPYDGRVCFKVLIDPKSYEVSGGTVAAQTDHVIDENFTHEELEWSTKSDRALYIYALLIRVTDVQK